MKIDKVQAFYTDEDRAALAEIGLRLDALSEEFSNSREEISFTGSARSQQSIYQSALLYSSSFAALLDEQNKRMAEIEQRYIDSFGGDTLAILEDVNEIVTATEKEEYTAAQEKKTERLKPLLANKPGKDAPREERRLYNATKAGTVRGFENCYYFILSRVRVQLNALNFYKDEIGIARAIAIVEDRAGQFYRKPKSAAKMGIERDFPRIIAAPTDTLDYPLDKVNNETWKLLAAKDPSGQIKLQVDTSGKKQDSAIIFYALDFEDLPQELQITRQLTPFDKRVYIASAALFNNGNKVFTTSQIFRAMGNTGSPTTEQVNRVNESLTKMGKARLYIDNCEEAKVYKGYPHFKYDAPLLPFERVSAYINNALCESAIHLFREPPLVTFARDRKQITTLPVELLESPISKTDSNLRIDDYLIERISRMKSGKAKTSRRMLYKKIFEECGISSRMQRSRAPEKIKRYLDHYKAKAFITDYKEDPDGVTIIL